ncbi:MULTISPECIES: RloB family protein [unclassified Okeania]|uniref:RloB family protein n=1 Tax=unclassified Okeania TaxID=2634635 RepID=UPI0013BA6DCE|nr:MULTISPECIES: RloB family protein [unclassified Okeania]NES75276.1 RloB domain-containing protein [Okeania sp. SIO1H4]NET13186.1 RloB domain-containing protein [Okeania sp. SIO1H6]NET19186.1 RloB domain-containing protein [Okeania sp. SIO1H5]NET93542.1 RloB domain-containing protein [Okeania sp. SIO1H2]
MAKKKEYKRNYQHSGKSKYSRYSRNDTVATREVIERFLIVCEGKETEPNYFRSFRVPKDVIDIRGLGKNTISLVEDALKIMKEDGNYNQVWCVFDRDSFPVKNFNQAIKDAKNYNIEVAYSNEAFEIWYLLHFEYRDTAMSRKDYKKALTEKLNKKYEKNSKEMYEILKNKQLQAIKNAEKLLEQHNPPNPVNDNPSTTVHLLVKELNKFVRP